MSTYKQAECCVQTRKGQLIKVNALPDQERKQRDLAHVLDVPAASKVHHRISHIYGNMAQNLYPNPCGNVLAQIVVWTQSTIVHRRESGECNKPIK